MAKKLRRAFTIVELVIVIAVIAILAAVLIPTFTTLIDKANQSADTSNVKNMNSILAMDETTNGKPKTMYDAVKVIREGGYDLEKLTPTGQGYDIVWDQDANRLLMVNGNEVIFGETEKNVNEKHLWVVVDSPEKIEATGYSVYLMDVFEGTVTAEQGVDVGSNEDITEVTYTTNDTQNVTIRTNGGALVVDAEQATVSHYGAAASVDIKKVDKESYYEYGTVAGNITLKQGRFVAEDNSSAAAVIVTATNVNAVEIVINDTTKTWSIAAENETVAGGLKDIVIGNTANAEIAVSPVMTGFAGGVGTESSPYQIATAEQFKNLKGAGYPNCTYYVLIADIHFNVEDFEISSDGAICVILGDQIGFNLDGQGHSLSADTPLDIEDGIKHSFIFYEYDFAVISNVNLVINSYDTYFIFVYNANKYSDGNSKFINVDVISTEENAIVTGDLYNNAPYVYYPEGGTITFESCDNYVNYNSTSAAYYAIYIGAYSFPNTNLNVTFKDCNNYGKAIGSGCVAMFVGNANQADLENHGVYTVENCYNYGVIQGAKGAGLFPVNVPSAYFAELNNKYTSTVNKGFIGKFELSGFEYNVTDSNEIAYQIEDLTNVSSIYLTLSAGISYYDENGNFEASGAVQIIETISEVSNNGTFTYRHGKFIDRETFDTMNMGIELTDENAVTNYNGMTVYCIEYQGNNFYVVVSDRSENRIKVNTNANIFVTACDASGQVIGNALLTENK